ncbi:MAG TPA: hypothetical protein VIM98_13745 [Dyella sp.]|uniref:hypothetical protein n=1 Tax=Dyella sp. TaxID=1869338 RepID=UPI002F958647
MPKTSVRATPKALPGKSAWRLETFDLRAGLAFATYRPAQRESNLESPDLAKWPCLFFSPPAFEAQPVGNVALALAASRQAFDAPLLDGKVEAGFASPEEVSDFVRRAYVASATGDGFDGPSGPDVPPPPRRPDQPLESDFRDSEDWETDEASGFNLSNDLKKFGEKALKGKSAADGDSQAFEFSWSPTPSGVTCYQAMRRGARHLLIELLERRPDPQNEAALVRWAHDLRRLGWFISRCGLLEALFVDVRDSRQGRLQQAVRQAVRKRFHEDRNGDLRIAIDYLLGGCGRFWEGIAPDVVDSLAQWPAPDCTQGLGPTKNAGRCSALALLAALTSSPAALSVLGRRGKLVAVDVAVFASACINCRDDIGSMHEPWLLFRDVRAEAFAEDVGVRALTWLLGQLPKRGFSFELEQLISDARNITYGKGELKAVPVHPTPTKLVRRRGGA